ncbi:MAG: molecular chaperone HscC [Pirellulaceae bacterium]|jgi:molecular chaperone HscC
MSKIVGIDLGTTNSLCAIFEDGEPKLIPNAHNDVLTPSVVGILDDGQVIIGAPAVSLQVTKPDRTASRFKRYMGTDRKLAVADQEFSAAELSSLVLKSLKGDAEAYLGESVDEAVITVPAYFNDHQRKATKLAGELAGLTVRRIINEPTAAALTYGFHERDAEKHILVIDLGGGTFDVTLMEIFEGTLEIVSTSGENFLGGEDFTDRIVSSALKKINLLLETAEMRQPLRVARLRQESEKAKRELFEVEEVAIRIPSEQGEFDESTPAFALNRDSFALICEPLLKRLGGPVGKALRDGGVEPELIGDVILVGGATRMLAMHEYLQEQFQFAPSMKFNPDEVVGLGASVQAALINDDRAVEDMVMTDVCPHTLGVEIVKEFGHQHMPGYFQPIIHRNTTIPVSREETVSTIINNQREILVRVFQGEARKTKDNLLLGELRVEEIPPGPPGTEIAIRFTYDINGIIEVEAFVPSTGKKFHTVLTQHASGMSQELIDEAVSRLQQLKFYPRDDVENQRLVLYCEQIVGEVNKHQREQLEEAIDMFEQAMASGDRDFFDHARSGLLITINQLGFNYE